MILLHIRELAVTIATNVHCPRVKGLPGNVMAFTAMRIVFTAEGTEETAGTDVAWLGARTTHLAIAIAAKDNRVTVCARCLAGEEQEATPVALSAGAERIVGPKSVKSRLVSAFAIAFDIVHGRPSSLQDNAVELFENVPARVGWPVQDVGVGFESVALAGNVGDVLIDKRPKQFAIVAR
jgi:hypothetical protein